MPSPETPATSSATSQHPPRDWTRTRASATSAPALATAIYAVIVGVLIASQRIPERIAFDQKLYHARAIDSFAQRLPEVDVWDYLSATTPGYHLLLGALSRGMGAPAPTWLLQTASATITGGLVWLFAWTVAQRRAGAESWRGPGSVGGLEGFWPVLLCLPVLASNYTLLPGAYLLPDNAGWLGVLAMLVLALRPPTLVTLLGGGLVLVYLVCVRQSHAWAAGLLWFGAWIGTRPQSSAEASGARSTPPLDLRVLVGAVPARIRRGAIALLCTLPGLVLLGLFVRYWGGLVPPRFQLQYPPRSGMEIITSPAPGFVLATTGFFALLLVGFWWSGLRALWRTHRAWVIGAAGVGLLIALVPGTTYDPLAGRSSGLWRLAQLTPALGGHASPVLVGLAGIGAVALLSLLSLQRGQRDRWILLAALAGYALTLSASREVWQRYTEPMVLMVLLLACAGVPSRYSGAGAIMSRAGGIAVLTIICGLLTIRLFAGAHAMQDPAPASMDPATHRGTTPACDVPRPPRPQGREFWQSLSF